MVRNNFAPYGGGIANSGILMLRNVIVRDNQAVQGAGIYNYGKHFHPNRLIEHPYWDMVMDSAAKGEADGSSITTSLRFLSEAADDDLDTGAVDRSYFTTGGEPQYAAMQIGNLTLIDSTVLNNTAAPWDYLIAHFSDYRVAGTPSFNISFHCRGGGEHVGLLGNGAVAARRHEAAC